MLFYKIEALPTDENIIPDNRERNSRSEFCLKFKENSENFYHKQKENKYMFVSAAEDRKLKLGLISVTPTNAKDDFWKYIKPLGIEISNVSAEEITLRSLNSMLSCAERNSYISDDDEILDRFGLGCLVGHRSYSDYGESLIEETTKTEQLKTASEFLMEGTLTPEIERIYAIPATKNQCGHPVHYILRTDDKENRKTIYKTLLSALYQNNRIKSKRYCFVDYDCHSSLPDGEYDALYKSCESGAIIVRYSNEDNENGRFASASNAVISGLCETALKYRNKVLTVFCLPLVANKTRETFLTNLTSTSFIELYEDIVTAERGKEYLKMLAQKSNIRADKNLFPDTKEGQLLTVADLKNIFDKWYDKKLRNNIFPQYKEAKTVEKKILESAPQGSAYERLVEMIGLKSAKETIDQALNFYKAQKLFKNRNVSFNRPAMHMVFTGNPGTAKTTVARLFAEIMKENGLLSKGDLYEVGRADLVGKYVGYTAPLVRDAFKRAKGSVLFIDEAYSLVEKEGLYGDEAINTIVQEMENNRDDMIVIFAGYPDEMEKFLNKNPGLRSRIAFHIPFEDYSSSELCDISKRIAKSRGLILAEDALNKLDGIFETARKKSDFGNGRYARNIIEKAQMAQTNRLIKSYTDDITDEDLSIITAEDIEIPKVLNETVKIKIGFAS